MQNAAFLPVAPEAVLLLGALVVLLTGVVWERPRREWVAIAGLTIAAALVLAIGQWLAAEPGGELFFSAAELPVLRTPMVVLDPYSALTGVAIFAVAFLGLLVSWDLVVAVGRRGAELVALFLLATAGLHGMAIAANLVVLFVSLETASLGFYVMAGFTRDRATADEAALKYFLLGSVASAIFVYGVALAFAGTGSTAFYGVGGIREFLSTTVVTRPGILLAGVAMMLVGLTFKVSGAPFHQWAPDVYQGAPGGITGFLAAGAKLAGFVALGRVLAAGFVAEAHAWVPVVAILAGVSVIVGVLSAAVQSDVKRILAYSGVAHAGYLLVALVAGADGLAPMLFYVGTYAFMLLGAFTVLAVVAGPRAGGTSLGDLAGLWRRAPGLATSMLVIMFGLAGIPLTAGFVGKVLVFTAAARAGYLWLVVLALVTTVVGLYFYLRVVGAMFLGGGEDAPPLSVGLHTRIVLAVVLGVTVLAGVVPWPLVQLVRDALPR